MDYGATLKEDQLIRINTKIESKIDFSIMNNIKEVSIETGIDWEMVNFCNLSFKFNVHEISRGEKGLFLFRLEDKTDFLNKSIICCRNLKGFQMQIDSPEVKNNSIDYKPSLIIRKTNNSSCNCFSYEDVFEVFQKFGEDEKVLCAISYKKSCNSFIFYVGSSVHTERFKVVGQFSSCRHSTYKLLPTCKPSPVSFEILQPMAIEIKVGSLVKHYRSPFEDLDVEKMVISFPPDATAEEKVWLICLGAIINSMLFGEND